MKNVKKVLATSMALVVSASLFAGCGGGTKNEDALQIGVAKLGYGTLWLENIIDAYEKKTGKAVELTIEIGQKGNAKFEDVVDSKETDLDLIFHESDKYKENIYAGSISKNGVTYDCLYADLSDVYTATLSDGSTITKKMSSQTLERFNYDGKYYTLPWSSSIVGIVRNINVWNSLGLTDADIPLTTNQLHQVADKIVKSDKNTKGIAPFIYCDADEYYTLFTPIWFAQYEGRENMGKFAQGKDVDGDRSVYLYDYQGQKEALKVVGDLLTTDGFQHERAKSQEFTIMQGLFLEGQAVFCVNGSWLELEMGNYTGANIDYIRTPVISSIINYGVDQDQDGMRDPMTTITNDAKLAEVIKAVDEGKTEVAGVDAAEFAIVKAAREISYLESGNSAVGYVPAYADKVAEAKEFLKFMYSDEGLNIYYTTLKGATLPVVPTTGWSKDVQMTTFRNAVNKAETDGFVFNYGLTGKIFSVGGVDAYWRNGTTSIVANFRKGKEAGKTVAETAETIIAANRMYLTNNWQNLKDFR